jgi:lactate dehydrogenase-like 2-hydroxyacid dehydrogenase
MNREFLELGLVGDKGFAVTKGIESQKVGIIGLGRIGTRIAEMLSVFNPESISYYSQHRHEDKEESLGVRYLDILELLKQSDIVFLCAGDDAKNLIGPHELEAMKQDSLLVNITHPGIINEEALFRVLNTRKIRAISDYPMSPKFNTLPFSHWYSMKSSNTVMQAGVKLMSDMAVESMLNLLSTGEDQFSIK